jgi:hypothetical protein
MKRNRLKIRIWLTLALTATSLALASSASAFNAAEAGGPSVTPQVPVVTSPSGFNWADAAIDLTVVLAAIAVAYLARNRNRSRLAASH